MGSNQLDAKEASRQAARLKYLHKFGIYDYGTVHIKDHISLTDESSASICVFSRMRTNRSVEHQREYIF